EQLRAGWSAAQAAAGPATNGFCTSVQGGVSGSVRPLGQLSHVGSPRLNLIPRCIAAGNRPRFPAPSSLNRPAPRPPPGQHDVRGPATHKDSFLQSLRTLTPNP
ncbi:hypothetical protein T484DRAFT_1897479, partial [Baffinella frigidus]